MGSKIRLVKMKAMLVKFQNPTNDPILNPPTPHNLFPLVEMQKIFFLDKTHQINILIDTEWDLSIQKTELGF